MNIRHSKNSRINSREKRKILRKGKILPSKKLPIPDQETPVYMTNWPVKEIIKMKQAKVMIKPDYQRKPDIWDGNRTMKPDFIKTILERQMIEPLTLQETPGGQLLLLNGQQRTDDIVDFYKNKIAIPASVDRERADKTFKKLTETEKKIYLNYRMAAIVLVSSNGRGKAAYIHGGTTIPHSQSEKIRAEYHDTKFYKKIESLLRLTGFKEFFYKSGVLSPAAIRRSKDEAYMGDLLLLASNGACDGKDFVGKLDDFKKKPKLYNEFNNSKPEIELARYIRFANRIFGTKGLKGTHFDNLTGCYRLLGAIRNILEESGGANVFSNARCKRMSKKLISFVEQSTRKGRRGTAIGDSARYYATISRSTRDKSVRLEGINIIRKQILSA